MNLLKIRRFPSNTVLLACALLIGSSTLSNTASAQISTGQAAAEGINATIDKKRRSPVIVSSIERTTDNVKVLVDAYVPATDYAEYPIEFKFFINGEVFATQIRSKNFNRPIGIDIPTASYPPPFNYSIVATLLHPNRQFVSIYENSIFANNLSAKLNCSVSVVTPASGTGETASETAYTAENVTISQTAESEISFNFTGQESANSSNTKEFSGLFAVSGTSLSGTISENLTNEDGASASGTINSTTGETSETLGISVTSDSYKIECGDMTIPAETAGLSLESGSESSGSEGSELNNTYYETDPGDTSSATSYGGDTFIPLSEVELNEKNLEKVF